MGPSPFLPKQKLQYSNQHFLSLAVYPDNNKMLAYVFVPSFIALNRWASDLIKVAQNQPQNILIPKQYKITEKSACGEGVTIEIEFECYYIPLLHEINKRGECEKYLEESQMWYLLYCLVQSAVSCSKLGERIGDLAPRNILLSRQGKLKILSKMSIPNYLDPITDSMRKNVFFSPQELEIIKKGYKDCPLDFIVTQSFSIGMTMLSAGTLEDLIKCYDYSKSQLNKIQFNKTLNFWQQNEFYSEFQKRKTHYSQQLKTLVCGLLQLNPSKRKTSVQVYNLLQPHMVAIMRMQPFDLASKKPLTIGKLDLMNEKEKNSAIHILRSKKKNQFNSSPKKVEQSNRLQNDSFDLAMQFSFRTPGTNKSPNSKTVKECTSHTQKIRLTNPNRFRKNPL